MKVHIALCNCKLSEWLLLTKGVHFKNSMSDKGVCQNKNVLIGAITLHIWRQVSGSGKRLLAEAKESVDKRNFWWKYRHLRAYNVNLSTVCGYSKHT